MINFILRCDDRIVFKVFLTSLTVEKRASLLPCAVNEMFLCKAPETIFLVVCDPSKNEL